MSVATNAASPAAPSSVPTKIRAAPIVAVRPTPYAASEKTRAAAAKTRFAVGVNHRTNANMDVSIAASNVATEILVAIVCASMVVASHAGVVIRRRGAFRCVRSAFTVKGAESAQGVDLGLGQGQDTEREIVLSRMRPTLL